MTVSLWAELLLRSSVQGGIAAALVWGLFRVFPRIPASIQGWMWRLIALKFLIGLTIPISYQTVRGQWGTEAPPDKLEILIFSLSIASIALALVVLSRDLLILRKLKSGAEKTIYPETKQLAMLMGIRRRVTTFTSPKIDQPMAAGILRPAIYLPTDLDQDTLKVVLAHELAHIKRRDLGWQWLFAALDTLFFFHPLARLAKQEYQKCQETACDALAMDVCRTSMAQYGRILLQFTVSSKYRELTMVANMAGTYGNLYSRIVRLHTWQRQLAISSKLLLACLAITLLPTWKIARAAPIPIHESEIQALARIAEPMAITRTDSAPAIGRIRTLKEGRP